MEKQTREEKELGGLVAGIALLVTIGSFIIIYLSWSYASAYLGFLGLPPYYIISLARGFVLFPYIGYLSVGGFVFVISLGVMVGHFLKKSNFWGNFINRYLFLLLLFLTVICVYVAFSQYVTFLSIGRHKWLTMVTFVVHYLILLPLCGVLIASEISLIKKSNFLMLFILLIVSFLGNGSRFMEDRGEEMAQILLRSKGALYLGHEIPSVTVISNVDLDWGYLRVGGIGQRGRYVYDANGIWDIRLIFFDNERYCFLLEKNWGEGFELDRLKSKNLKFKVGSYYYRMCIVDRSKIEQIIYRHELSVSDDRLRSCGRCHEGDVQLLIKRGLEK